MNLVIFTGPPASGKTSIANECSLKLGITCISKDQFKLQLFDKYGFSSHKEKQMLSIQGMQKFLNTIKEYCVKDRDILIDCNFKHYNDLRAILLEQVCKCNIICICLHADSKLLAKRYNERITSGKREISLYCLNQYPVIDGITQFHSPLNYVQVEEMLQSIEEETYGNHSLYVDTNNLEKDFQFICQKIIEYIKENLQ